MELDALKTKWAEQDRKLDENIRLNQRFLVAAKMSRAQWPIRLFTLSSGVGTLLGLITLAMLGRFIYTHWSEPRFSLPAIALHLWVIAYVATSIRQLVMALEIDFDQSITLVQTRIESLRALRLNVIRWALLTGQLVWWIPMLIVAFKAFWNVDLYTIFGSGFLIVNIAIGVAVIPVAIGLSKKFGERINSFPKLRRLTRELAGYNLNTSIGFLRTLSEFKEEKSV